METTQPVYDSITAGALRMARRHWYVVVAAAALGLVGGFVATRVTETWHAETSVRIQFESVTRPAATKDVRRSTVDPVSIARRVDDSTGGLGLPSGVAVEVEGDTTAGSITIDSTGSSEQEAVQAADAVAGLARDLTVEEASAATRTAIAGLEQVVAGSTERLRLADERLAAMEAAGETPGPTNPAVLERTAAADALAVATSELEQARSELEALSSGTVTVVEASASPADPSILVPLALAALAAGLAFLALLAVQALDGRIRRRIHIERSAPRVRVIGVLSKSPSDAELALATRGTQRFMADNGLQRLLVVPLKGEASEELLEALADVAGGAVQPLDRGGALGELGTPEVGVLFEVPFGRVQEDVLQSAVTDAATVGTTAVAAMITGVPSADQAWASVSIH